MFPFVPTLSTSLLHVASSRCPRTQATVLFPTGSKARHSQSFAVFFYEMPHFIKHEDHGPGLARLCGRRRGHVGKVLRRGPDPVQNGDVADAQNPADAAKAHAADRVHRQRQILHRRRLASRRSIGEVHPAGFTQTPLVAAHETALHQIDRPAPLAANLRHDSPRSPVETEPWTRNG